MDSVDGDSDDYLGSLLLRAEQYPVPHIEDIFADLAGRKQT